MEFRVPVPKQQNPEVYLKPKPLAFVVDNSVTEIYAELFRGNIKAFCKVKKRKETANEPQDIRNESKISYNVLSNGPKGTKCDKIFGTLELHGDIKVAYFMFSINIEGCFYLRFCANIQTYYYSNEFFVTSYHTSSQLKSNFLVNPIQQLLPRIERIFPERAYSDTPLEILIKGINYSQQYTPKVIFGNRICEFPDVVWDDTYIKLTIKNGLPAGTYKVQVLFDNVLYSEKDVKDFVVLSHPLVPNESNYFPLVESDDELVRQVDGFFEQTTTA